MTAEHAIKDYMGPLVEGRPLVCCCVCPSRSGRRFVCGASRGAVWGTRVDQNWTFGVPLYIVKMKRCM